MSGSLKRSGVVGVFAIGALWLGGCGSDCDDGCACEAGALDCATASAGGDAGENGDAGSGAAGAGATGGSELSAGGAGGTGAGGTSAGGTSAGGAGGGGGQSGGGQSGGPAGGGTGGSEPCTSDCPALAPCDSAAMCSSGVCAGVCAVPACDDGVENADETDRDCGGSCPACAHGLACGLDTDCSTAHCITGVCVSGPLAGFQISDASGSVPHTVTLTSTSAPGDAAITLVEYSYGDGSGFQTATAHTYSSEGNFTITQRVADQNGLLATASVHVEVAAANFAPVLLSDSDRSPYPELALSADGLGMEIIDAAFAGVRSDRAVTPGSGMFYFEGERLTDELGDVLFGVVTESFPFDGLPGQDDRSFGIDISGSVFFDATQIDTFSGPDNTHYGFVVDYRGASPIVHLLLEGGFEISQALPALTEPVYIFVGGRRREVGVQARINPGNDTSNFPFEYDAEGFLADAAIDAQSLVLGWGQTHARPLSTPPSLQVTGPASVALGGSVTLNASASDVEDGDLGAGVHWADLSTPYATRDTHVGNSWTFSPRAIGIHPIEVSVTDSAGRTKSVVRDVSVTGTLPQFEPVRLVADALSGSGIELSADGLRAKWPVNLKYGVRANQGMIGEYRYFEMHRLIAPNNQGGGLVIAEGDLNPYQPTNIPPSCSINHSASVWRNLISEADYDTENTEYYGFAVDYRGRYPEVYVLTQEGAGAAARDIVAHVLTLDDVTVPIYPMLYGNVSDEDTEFDAEINFGALPFHYDPSAVLIADGFDPSGLELGWGDANGN